MPLATANDTLRTPRSAASLVPASLNLGVRSIAVSDSASSANDTGMPPPPQPASRIRPVIDTPACSRYAMTFALR